jgi:hypothetical protein
LLSALRRLAGEIENARAERLRIDELQSLLIAPVLTETLPAAHDNRMEYEPKLVEGVVGQRLVRVWVKRSRWRLLRPL